VKISIASQLKELDSLLVNARASVLRLDSLVSANDPFQSLAENANLHDWLNRSQVIADKLTRHYGSRWKRKGGAK
jgi:hypothetical protein